MNRNLWHLYVRLVVIEAISKLIDDDVWNSDDALVRTRTYLEELMGECEMAVDYIKELERLAVRAVEEK